MGAGPFVGYIPTRSTGLPGDSNDIGNWGETLGVVSLGAEGLLALLALAGLTVLRTSTSTSTSTSDTEPPPHAVPAV